MGGLFVVSVFILALSALEARGDDAAFAALLHKYEQSQNTLDAKLCVSLFDEQAAVFLPAGTPPLVGRAAILTAFQGFFGSLQSLQETLTTPILIHNNAAGYAKVLDAVVQNGCPVTIPAVQTFQWNNTTGLISQMSVVYNTTEFQRQASCK